MSLYFDAVSVLSGSSHDGGGSLKSRIYNGKWKSPPAQIYALIAEASKWNLVLKEVIDNSGLLTHETKVSKSELISGSVYLAVAEGLTC